MIIISTAQRLELLERRKRVIGREPTKNQRPLKFGRQKRECCGGNEFSIDLALI